MILIVIGLWLIVEAVLSIIFSVKEGELDAPIYQLVRIIRVVIGVYLHYCGMKLL